MTKTSLLPRVLEQHYELVDVRKIKPHPENPRRGNLEVLEESVGVNGFYGAIVVQRSTGFVLAGNHRLMAARRQGLSSVPAVWVDVDDEQARKILLVDNRSNDLATYDQAELSALLNDLPDLTGSGYSVEALTELGTQLPVFEPVGLTDPDDVPEPPKVARSKSQDVWLLGPHRLMCGDSANADDVQKLMAGERAHLMATDPPYLVNYTGRGRPLAGNAKRKDKDWSAYKDSEPDGSLYKDFLAHALTYALVDAAPIYQWHADMRRGALLDAWDFNGVLAHQAIIWVKSSSVPTRCHYMWQHEPCLYGWKQGDQPVIARRPPNNESTVWMSDQKDRSGLHPTEKPVELFTRPLEYHTLPGEVAFEPFSGSGAQILAAHQTGRRCYAMEISPPFVDVGCLRYQLHTGVLPVLEATGESVDFVKGFGDG